MATREEVLAATTIACKSEIVEDARLGGDGKVLIVELDSKAAVLLDESNFQTVGTQRKVIRDGLYNARWIVAFTEGGGMARMVSRLAGRTPILAATVDEHIAKLMGLLRGVTALVIPKVANTDDMVEVVRELLIAEHGAVSQDRIVMTMGLPLWKTGTTNTMKVMTF